MEIQTQFSVFLINKPGVLAAVTRALAEAGVNLAACALMDSGEHGALRLVCDNPDVARNVLNETHDRWTETEVLMTKLSDQPGAFATVAEKFTEAGVNITYAYLTGGPDAGRTFAVYKVSDVAKAQAALAE